MTMFTALTRASYSISLAAALLLTAPAANAQQEVAPEIFEPAAVTTPAPAPAHAKKTARKTTAASAHHHHATTHAALKTTKVKTQG